jgi:general secretion pathway protein D
VTFRLENADLLQFINLVATQLKMNYVVDPAVKGTVTISTAGDLRREDLFPILQSVLRINAATAIQSGNFYRIVPVSQAVKLPVEVSSDATGKPIPPDDRMMTRIIPLRFVLAADMAKLLTPFLSDGGTVAVHEAGNVLILLETSLNVKRLMEIIQQFDSMTFAHERIRLVPVQNNVASGLVPELESIFSAYAMTEKGTPIRFIALDRINSLLVVAAEPSAFEEVEEWIRKLDQPAPPSGVQTFIYRVQNSEAGYLEKLLARVEGGEGGAGVAATGLAGGGAGAAGAAGTTRPPGATAVNQPESGQTALEGVHLTTDPVNNSLIIQCTPQQYAEIAKTLKQLDVIPRQVMIEARVYEVDLTGALSFGVSYYLQQRSSTYKQGLATFSGTTGLQASAGMLIGQTRELMGFLTASENSQRVRVLSAPTVLATDNSDARINVGTTVPTLTSQGVIPGVQAGASSVFTNTVQNVETGIIMSVRPRITSTGLVTMTINQEVSAPVFPPAGSAIQSPSFSKRSITTSAVVGDGQTIALGGLISDNITYSRNRIPLLGDIPGLGALFGSTSYTRSRTELILLLTPHIVKNVQEAHDTSRELADKLQDLRKTYRKDSFLNP